MPNSWILPASWYFEFRSFLSLTLELSHRMLPQQCFLSLFLYSCCWHFNLLQLILAWQEFDVLRPKNDANLGKLAAGANHSQHNTSRAGKLLPVLSILGFVLEIVQCVQGWYISSIELGSQVSFLFALINNRYRCTWILYCCYLKFHLLALSLEHKLVFCLRK